MSINLNSVLLPGLPEPLALASRGLLYGDGLFETIRVFSGRIPFLHLHWQRLEAGLRVLSFDIPAEWSAAFFEKEILKLSPVNARIRISVWRSDGGFYFPANNKPNFFITAAPLDDDGFTWQDAGLKIRRCERVQLPVDAVSGLKTLGCTRQVVAAMEARAKGADDVIVLNARGLICEATSSNIFWIKDDIVLAPPTNMGQVTGTFQKILSRALAAEGSTIIEKAATFAELLEADEVFLTNAIQGIRWVRFLEDKEYPGAKVFCLYKLTVNYINSLPR